MTSPSAGVPVSDVPVSDAPVLAVQDLFVEFRSPRGVVHAVNGLTLEVHRGEMLAIVGETGSGKTTSMLAALSLLTGRVSVHGSVRFGSTDLLRLPRRSLRRLLGARISIVFQDPFAALNPVLTVGFQVMEAIRVHDRSVTKARARQTTIELLHTVGVPDPEIRFGQYPHQLSGGMCQRIAIAMAIANQPEVLIADEPTTALDVTIQAQLLELLRAAQATTGAAIVLITHDLGVVAQLADRVCVMYAGRAVETGSVHDVFAYPRHPYTAALLAAVPRMHGTRAELVPVPGHPPELTVEVAGCAFAPRCALAASREECVRTAPALRPIGDRPGQLAACHFAEELAPRPSAGDAR
jgi:oligopeptide/dipeptide ABC transporter ATP-binding protein